MMRKNEMKIKENGVFLKMKMSCKVKCDLKCAPLLLLPGPASNAYLLCVEFCQSKCHDSLNDVVHYCVTGCALIKSIHIINTRINSFSYPVNLLLNLH